MTAELFTPGWFSALATIVLIDLVLAGDNAGRLDTACLVARSHAGGGRRSAREANLVPVGAGLPALSHRGRRRSDG